MVTHTQNLCSAFNQSKFTHTVVNTHTHLEQCAAILRAVVVSLPCSRVSPQPWYWAWKRALVIHSPSPAIPAWTNKYKLRWDPWARHQTPNMRLEPVIFGLQVRLSIHLATTAPIGPRSTEEESTDRISAPLHMFVTCLSINPPSGAIVGTVLVVWFFTLWQYVYLTNMSIFLYEMATLSNS